MFLILCVHGVKEFWNIKIKEELRVSSQTFCCENSRHFCRMRQRSTDSNLREDKRSHHKSTRKWRPLNFETWVTCFLFLEFFCSIFDPCSSSSFLFHQHSFNFTSLAAPNKIYIEYLTFSLTLYCLFVYTCIKICYWIYLYSVLCV